MTETAETTAINTTTHPQALAAISLAADYAARERGVADGTRAQYLRAGKLLYAHSLAAGADFFRLLADGEPRGLLALAASQSRDGQCRVWAGYFRHLRAVAVRHLVSQPAAPAPAQAVYDGAARRRSLLDRVLRR